MNRSGSIILFAMLVISGCGVMQDAQRQEYIENTKTLSPTIRTAISNRQVSKGMTKNDVRASWGNPSEVQNSSWGDTWIYKNYRGRTLGTRFSFVYFNNNSTVRDWSVQR